MKLPDYYSYLEIAPQASGADVKRAYRRLARLYHPDSSKAPNARERFHQIQEAYETLSDLKKREAYDKQFRAEFSGDDRIRHYQKQQAQADAARTRGARAPGRESERRASTFGTRFQRSDESRTAAPSTGNDKAGADAGSILGKLKRSVSGSFKRPSKKHAPEPGFAERPFFQFTLNALESLRETTRELALGSGESPRVIRVKIPAGVTDGTILKVNCPASGSHPARIVEVTIRLERHELVERRDPDIVLHLPVTVLEAMTGAEIDAPTLTGAVRVRIPAPWSPEQVIKLSGGGFKTAQGTVGDFVIKPFIVLPELSTEASKQAAQVIDELYTGSVRRKLPSSLG
ncbi:MAG: DnaJ domain-containing protein [Bdellovibrionota bacterium]